MQAKLANLTTNPFGVRLTSIACLPKASSERRTFVISEAYNLGQVA